MKKQCKWWLLAGLCGLCLVQPPLHASQDAPSPAPAGEGDFGTYLSSLQEKAHNGDKAAARELAVHYDVAGNAPETSKWMSEYVSLAEKEANGGDMDSMLDLGKLFYTGSRLYPKNLEKARYWFTRAADSGNAAAQYQVAVMASKGTGGPKDEETASRYYEKALQTWRKEADAGDSKAALWAALVYERKLVPDSSPEKSVPYLLHAAESGNLTAQGLLAFKYRDGLGVPQDAAKAVEWFEKAAGRKDLGAVMELGMMYRDGKYMPPDREKALNWFEKGAEWKDPYSMAALADMLMEGSPSGEQAARALALYREAAAIGYPPAALKAAELLQNGKGGELDADEAYRLLRRAADATGDPKAMYMLAQVYYTRGDDAQGDSLMKASAQAAYLPAMNRMARLHLLPGSSMSWNPVLSYYYWNQAGELGDEGAASAAFWLLWGSMAALSLVIFLVVWRFHRFAVRRLAEQQKQEQQSSDDA